MTKTPAAGVCELCGERVSSVEMGAHLDGCLPAHDGRGAPRPLLRLSIQASGDPRYWLEVEADAAATFKQLDGLLRKTWLECCGHMSAFLVSGRKELAMSAALGDSFSAPGSGLDYEYDFGDTTHLQCRLTARRAGSPGRRVVRLLARNAAPHWRCAKCAAAAAFCCPLCFGEEAGLACKAHRAAHLCNEEGVWLPVVNSPRMGVCAYGRKN